MSRTTARRSERGQALPALALIVAGLVAFTTFVIVPLGSADDRRAETRTGARTAAASTARSAFDRAAPPLSRSSDGSSPIAA